METERDTTPREQPVEEGAVADAAAASAGAPAGEPAPGTPPPAGAGDGVHAAAETEPAPDEAAAQEVEQDLEQLQARARERDEYLALAQRTQADFENYRRRMAREVASAEQRGIGKVLKELLPTLDHLDLAIQAAGDEAHAEGIKLVRAELHAALARLGVEAFSPQGEAFDPNLHEAMAQQPSPDVQSGHVATVFQQGWRMHDTVLRPARVVVAA